LTLSSELSDEDGDGDAFRLPDGTTTSMFIVELSF
jgi:hypothetical protein